MTATRKVNELTLLGDIQTGDVLVGERTSGTTVRLTYTGSGGGGVSDGDKGDITISGSGTTYTIDANVVTYAKMQDVSSTDKLLGRSTAGSGDVEEITCTAAGRAILDDVDAAAQRTTLGLGTLATQSGTFSGTSSGTNTGDQTSIVGITGTKAQFDTAVTDGNILYTGDVNSFSTIAISGQSDVVADAVNDTLTLAAGSNITLTTNAGTDTVTIASTAGAQEWVLISTGTASSSASISFTGLSSAYNSYKVMISNLLPATNAVEFFMRTSTNNGSSYDSAAGNYVFAIQGTAASTVGGRNTSATEMQLIDATIFGTLANTSNEESSWEVTIFNPSSTTEFKKVHWMGMNSPASSCGFIVGVGARQSDTAVDAVQFLMSSGNISTGVFKLYGLKA